MLKEFREFIARGNVVDLAVGVVIGGAFGAIVKSLVDQIIMPPVGLITGGIDFAQLKWVLKPAVGKTAEVAVGYGVFVNAIIQFFIVAIAIFLMVKAINSVRRQAVAPAEAPGPTPSETLLTEIRDLLKSRAG
jgi:large conductance mechanosensitive channel